MLSKHFVINDRTNLVRVHSLDGTNIRLARNYLPHFAPTTKI